MGNTYCNYNWSNDKAGLDLTAGDNNLPMRRPTVTEEQQQYTNITESAVKAVNNKAVEVVKQGGGTVSVEPNVAAAAGANYNNNPAIKNVLNGAGPRES